MKTAAIVNPTSGGGRAGREWASIAARLDDGVETHFTKAPGDATGIVRDRLARGVRRIVAVGGDGTVNEVINGFFEAGRAILGDAELAVIPIGTGGDFRRTLGISGIDDALALLQSGAPATPADAGHVAYRTRAGQTADRYFANLVSFGMGGEVAARAKNFFQVFGGKAAFMYSTVEVALAYRARKVALRVDDEDCGEHSILNVAVGNGRYHGGGMHVCPRAAIDDGAFDVTVIAGMPLPQLVRDMPVLYSGDIYRHPKTQRFQGRRIEAASEETVSIEVDGEPLGILPVTLDVLPAAFRLLRR
ncbi:MAG: diacylglycerol kinase family lipid kinase [Bryobacteraceae bacterium]